MIVVPAIKLNPTTIAFIVGTLIPWLTAATTKMKAPDRVKNAVTAALAAGCAVLQKVAEGKGFTVSQAVVQHAALMFASAAISYQHVWRGWNLNARLAPARGLGTPEP